MAVRMKTTPERSERKWLSSGFRISASSGSPSFCWAALNYIPLDWPTARCRIEVVGSSRMH